MHDISIPYEQATESTIHRSRRIHYRMLQFLHDCDGESHYDFKNCDYRTIESVVFSFEDIKDALLFKLTFGGVTH